MGNGTFICLVFLLSSKKEIQLISQNTAVLHFPEDFSEAVAQRFSMKKVFLKNSQNSQEKTTALLKRDPNTVNTVNFAIFLRTPPDDCY